MENKSFLNRLKFIYNSPFLLIFFTGIFVNLDKLLMGKFTVAKDHDFWDTMWPIQAAMVERLKLGKFPLWLAGYQSGSQFCFWDINWISIPVLLTFFSKGFLGYFIIMFVQYVIAAGGMYLFLKKFYPERTPAEFILGGILYAMAIINLTYWRVPDLAILPLGIYSFYEFVDFFSGKKESWLSAICSYAIFSLNVYFLKGLPSIACFLLFIILFFKPEQIVKKLVIFFFFNIFVVLINAPTLANNIAYIGYGMRQVLVHPALDHNAFSLYFSRFMDLIKSPHDIVAMTSGTTAAFIFFISLLNFKKWARLTKILFYYFLLASLIFYFCNNTPWFEAIRRMLPFSTYHLNHLLLVFPFILFLVVFENITFFAHFLKKHSILAWLIICTITTVLMIWHPRHGFPTSIYEMLTTGLAFLLVGAIFYFMRKKEVSNAHLILIFSCAIFAERFLHMYSTKVAIVNPPSFQHFAISPSYSVLANEPVKYNYRMTYINWHPSIGLYNGFQVAGGESNDYLMGYAHYWNLVVKEDPKYFAYPYKAYLDDPSTLFESPAPNIHTQLNLNFDLLAFNNVKYIFTIHEIQSPEQYGLKLFSRGISPVREVGLGRLKQAFTRITESPVYFVYLVDNYAPRFFMNKSAQFFPSEKSLISHMKIANRKTLPLSTLLVEDNIPSSLKKDLEVFNTAKEQSIETVDPTTYDDDKIDFSINVKEPSFLIVNDNYSPYWYARVNGEDVPVLKAYLTLKAIPLLKPGMSKIELYYAPRMVLVAYYLSALAMIILLTVLLLTGYTTLRRRDNRLK